MLKQLGHGSLPTLLANSEDLNAYIASLLPVVDYKMQQTSGTNEPNAGSLGSALDMTLTSVTLGQTSIEGVNEAYLMDGANSRMQTPNNPTLAGYTAWEYIFLVKPSSAGEISFGTFFMWGNESSKFYSTFQGGLTALNCVLSNTINSSFITTTTSGLSTSAFQLLFIAFDNAGDRKAHLRKGVSGAVAEFGYSAQPAMTGTYRAPSVALNLFNASDQSLTFAGLAGRMTGFNRNLTDAERLKITKLVGV